MMIDAIIVLGHTNDAKGNISVSARNRLNSAIDLFHQKKAKYVVVSAGTWPHFNASPKPHSFWMKKYLMEKGIQKKKVIEEKHARWTIENASLCLEIAQQNNWKKLIVVTSSWHMLRTRIIFGLFFPQSISCTYKRSYDAVLPKPKFSLYMWEIKGILRDVWKIVWFKITRKGFRAHAQEFRESAMETTK